MDAGCRLSQQGWSEAGLGSDRSFSFMPSDLLTLSRTVSLITKPTVALPVTHTLFLFYWSIVDLQYSIVLVSNVPQSDSIIYTYILYIYVSYIFSFQLFSL